jgi:protein-S-isoprenylcysteine O-methyltransferase Ste14
MAKPLVFEQAAATVVFSVSIGVWTLFEFVMRLRQRSRSRGKPARDPSAVILAGCLAASVVAAILLGRHGTLLWPGGRLWPPVAGITLVAVGISLRAWSISTLGRFFQYRIEVQPDHHVVTGGPYRYVRHPSYTGVALVVLGIALAAGAVLSLVVTFVLSSVGLVVRIRAEERQLTDALGVQYQRFAAKRKRLIPGLL